MMMKGWTPDGQEVELMPEQAAAVQGALAGKHWPGHALARQSGRSTVLATAYRLDRGPSAGLPTDLRLYETTDYPLPARGVSQIGWIDQRGNVYTKCPPISTFRGGSLTPLLIACEEGETVVTRLRDLVETFGQPGVWDASRYSTGLHNGAEMALAVVEGRPAHNLRNRPPDWLWRKLRAAWRRLKLRLCAPAVDDDDRPFPVKATGTFPAGQVSDSVPVMADRGTYSVVVTGVPGQPRLTVAGEGETDPASPADVLLPPYPADLVPKEPVRTHRLRLTVNRTIDGITVPYQQVWDVPVKPAGLSVTLPADAGPGAVIELKWEDPDPVPESANEGDDSDDRTRE